MKPCLLASLVLALTFGGAVRTAEPPSRTAIRLPVPPPPVPPARKAPSDLFRELLAATPEERDAFLAARSPAARDLIRTKLEEFEALPREQRERRLRVAEIEFHFAALLRAPAEGRARLLAGVPIEWRALVEDRLRTWDALPEARRQELLPGGRPTLELLTRLRSADAATRTRAATAAMPPPLRTRGIAAAPATGPDDLQRFLTLNRSERTKILKRMTPRDRLRAEQTLVQLQQLPEPQREQVVRGLRRYLEMAPAQREAFLVSAERWQQLSPSERDAWRRTVGRVAGSMPQPMPPARGGP